MRICRSHHVYKSNLWFQPSGMELHLWCLVQSQLELVILYHFLGSRGLKHRHQLLLFDGSCHILRSLCRLRYMMERSLCFDQRHRPKRDQLLELFLELFVDIFGKRVCNYRLFHNRQEQHLSWHQRHLLRIGDLRLGCLLFVLVDNQSKRVFLGLFLYMLRLWLVCSHPMYVCVWKSLCYFHHHYTRQVLGIKLKLQHLRIWFVSLDYFSFQ